MSETTFKPGDVVQLNSGGPKMTVMKLQDAGHVLCQWHDGTEFKSKEFLSVVLYKIA